MASPPSTGDDQTIDIPRRTRAEYKDYLSAFNRKYSGWNIKSVDDQRLVEVAPNEVDQIPMPPDQMDKTPVVSNQEDYTIDPTFDLLFEGSYTYDPILELENELYTYEDLVQFLQQTGESSVDPFEGVHTREAVFQLLQQRGLTTKGLPQFLKRVCSTSMSSLEAACTYEPVVEGDESSILRENIEKIKKNIEQKELAIKSEKEKIRVVDDSLICFSKATVLMNLLSSHVPSQQNPLDLKTFGEHRDEETRYELLMEDDRMFFKANHDHEVNLITLKGMLEEVEQLNIDKEVLEKKLQEMHCSQ